MNQFVAIVRRATAILAAFALLSSLSPGFVRAQSDPKPADPAPPPSEQPADVPKPAEPEPAATEPPAEAAKPGKQAKAKKPPKAAKAQKAEQTAVTKPAKAAKPRASEKTLAERKQEDGIYAKGSDWIAMRFGYAKRTGDLGGDGFVGYGMSYQHMMSKKYAFAAGAGHDIVGHFAGQIDEAVPFTGEFQRHFNWKTAARPYIGLGGGFYLRKNYRTGLEYTTTTTGGPHVSIGFTSALDDRHLIGFETRVASLKGRSGVVNPTFGPGESTETIWTVKLIWGLAY